MLTQIYEVATAAEAQSFSLIGIDHIGVLVGEGEFPRELALPAARRVASGVRAPAKLSALLLSADLSLIEEWARVLRPDILHLGTAPELVSPEDAARLKRRLPGMAIMRSIAVVDETSVESALAYRGAVDFLLLDSHRDSDRQIGALGVTHDWAISRRIVELVQTPVILAGGLGPENVADAIRAVRPAGVDSKTKTDRPGSHQKDLELVRRFHQAAHAAGSS